MRKNRLAGAWGLGLAIIVGFTFPCQAKVTLENLKTEPLDNYGADIAPSSQWTTNNPIPNSSSGVGLDAHTGVNGYVILNKEQGLIKQWGRVNIPSLGTVTVRFPHRMSRVYSINISSSDIDLSSAGRGTIETSTRVSGYTPDQFKIVRGYIGDSKGRFRGGITVFWSATGKL